MLFGLRARFLVKALVMCLIGSLTLTVILSLNPLTTSSDCKCSSELPSEPKPIHRLAVVVPFRDRFDELLTFVPHMSRFLKKQGIAFKIYVINQKDSYRFNRASLINIGYLVSRTDCDYLAMHDVDLLPLNPNLTYGYPADGPFHLAAPELHPKYHYKTFVGGILLISRDHFEKVNGLSNNYWGWGLEDDEFYARLRDAKLAISRPVNITTGPADTFRHIHRPNHKRDTTRLFNQREVTRKRDRKTGLNTIKFNIIDVNHVTIEDASAEIYTVELICDLTATPWCQTQNQNKQKTSSSLQSKNLLKEFSNHEEALPEIYPPFKQSTSKNQIVYEKDLKISIKAFNKLFILQLTRNEELIPSNYFERHHCNGSHVISTPHSNNPDHCHYKGRVVDNKDSWAAISTCNRSISGLFTDGNDIYHLHPKENSPLVYVLRDSELNSQFKCGFTNTSLPKLVTDYKRLAKRSLTDPYNSDSTSRYVELVIVNDFQVYTEYKKKKDVVFDRTKRIANIVNALYNQLNIFVVLVGVVIWTEQNEITMSNDGDQTLTNFLQYRRERLIPEHMNDNAQLITGSAFDGGVVGKALKGSICTFEYSGGVNTDHSHVTSLVATTVAHELGHNFGMEHDSDKCKCADDKCIMAPSSSSVSPKHWSSCSVEYLEHAIKQGMDHCLHNKPQKLVGPVCGNGFIEEGEQCDCGLKMTCDNKCCNATTCQLAAGAECAVGSCCDKTKCRIVAKDEQIACRPAKSNCDLTEFCDGVKEFCPDDLQVQDGTQCKEGFAYCYKGKCDTREGQCKLLWGATGEVSDYKCYQQNIKGNANGNCGYFKHNQTYVSCKPQDVICGRLHCFHQSEQLKYGTESAAILARSFIPSKGKILACRSAMVDLGIDVTDPGLVPNGAKCGANSMCVDQKCVAVKGFLQTNPCRDDCNGNGLCDNTGNCHCYPGYAPPHCSHTVLSGYFFTIAMYIIFLVILPLTAITAFLIYNYNDSIKNWWFIKARKSAIKSRAKQMAHRKPPPRPANALNSLTLEISGPLAMDASGQPTPQTVISLPLKEVSSSGHAANGTLLGPAPQNQTTIESQLRPIRPAPPPPISNHSSISRSSSTRSSNRSPATRPSQPPPRPPRVTACKPETNLAKVQPLNVPEFAADKPLPPPPASKPTHISRTNGSPKQTYVANLAKKFENTNV